MTNAISNCHTGETHTLLLLLRRTREREWKVGVCGQQQQSIDLCPFEPMIECQQQHYTTRSLSDHYLRLTVLFELFGTWSSVNSLFFSLLCRQQLIVRFFKEKVQTLSKCQQLNTSIFILEAVACFRFLSNFRKFSFG